MHRLGTEQGGLEARGAASRRQRFTLLSKNTFLCPTQASFITGQNLHLDTGAFLFAGPRAVLAYLARYTHPVAISNARLIALDQAGVTFKRAEAGLSISWSGKRNFAC